MMPAQLPRRPIRNFVRTGKACITSAIMTEDSDRERQGMPEHTPKRPTRTDLISALPENACSDFAGKNPAAFRVFAACVKLADAWGTLYHSAADIGEAIKLHRANVGSALRALIAEGWAEVKASSPGKTPTLSLIGPKITQTGGTSALYVMSNSPNQASETHDRGNIVARVDAQAQQPERAAMPQPDAHAQPPAPLPFVAPAQQPDAQAQHHQTRRRNSQPDAQAQQPDAQAQQPDAQAQPLAPPLEPPPEGNSDADRSRVCERAHAREAETGAAAAAGKLRGDGKARQADGGAFADTPTEAHPVARFLSGFLDREQVAGFLRQHGPDRVLRILEIGAAADPEGEWHFNRLKMHLAQHGTTPVDTTAQKTTRIRAAAPVANHNAERFAAKHPTAYIVATIREKQAEARTHGADARLSPEKLVLALKCNDTGWTVEKHLAPIIAQRRAELARIHNGTADKTRAAVEKPGQQQRQEAARQAQTLAESNAAFRKRHADALANLTGAQLAAVRAIVASRITDTRARRDFNNDATAHTKSTYAPLVIEAAAEVRSPRHIVPEPENTP